MSMLMAALLLPTLASPGQSTPVTEFAETCRELKFHRADRPSTPRSAEPLNRQPLARQEKMVMYSEGKCVKPILVRENVGTEQR